MFFKTLIMTFGLIASLMLINGGIWWVMHQLGWYSQSFSTYFLTFVVVDWSYRVWIIAREIVFK